MQTDRQTDKSSRWAFTAYEDQWGLFKEMPNDVAEWGWQTEECPDTGRKHYQGYMRTHKQVRHAALRKLFPGVHIEVARNWNKLINYCKKTESSIAGTQVYAIANRQYLKMHEGLIRVARAYDYIAPLSLLDKDQALTQVAVDEKERYWSAVRRLVLETLEDISFYTDNRMIQAWVNTKDVWLYLAGHEDFNFVEPESPTSWAPEECFIFQGDSIAECGSVVASS